MCRASHSAAPLPAILPGQEKEEPAGVPGTPNMKSILERLRGVLNDLATPSIRTYEGLLMAEDFFNGPTLDWEPEAGKVVVLAPHMDDEIIGCGGTIARHAAAGASVTVVYLTDGRRGSAALFKL